MNTGDQGERGQSGDRGVTGERGAKGDHGQDGEKGDTGARGLTGEPAPYLGRAKTLALFAFVVLAFFLLAWRSEINTSEIAKVQTQSCEISRSILVKYNSLQQANILIETDNKFIDDKVRALRVKAYTEAILPVPDCADLQ